MKAIIDTQHNYSEGLNLGASSARAVTMDRLIASLASSKSGRVILHAVCLFRHPSHAQWHWRGMVRELAG